MIVFGSKMWLVAGTDGSVKKNDVWNSTDGVTWTEVNSSTIFSARENLASLVFDNKMWVTGGFNGIS
jgi:hypothetical protein